MARRRIAVGLTPLLGLLASGCPPAGPPAAPAGASAGKPAPVPADPPSPPTAPAPTTPPPPVATPDPEPPPLTRPPAPPPSPSTPAGAPREEQLRRGTRRGFEGERAVGLVEVLAEGDGQPARARLSVAAGPAYLEALLPAGGSVLVGGQRLEVVALEPPRAIRIRLHPGAPVGAPLHPVPTPGPRWRLAGLALHELPGGVQVGVGNVRREGHGPQSAARVTLTVFPATYARDPGQGYDRHLDVSAGQALEGQVLRGRIVALDPGPEPGGAVEVELLPP